MNNLNKQSKNAAVICFGFAIAFIALSTMSGCGQGPMGETGAQGPMGSVTVLPAPSPSPTSEVQSLVNSYNQYLVSVGNDPIQPGLKCTLYNVPNMPNNPCLNGNSIPGCNPVANSAGYTNVGSFTYTGTLDQPNENGTSGFNILPTNLQSVYTTNFAVTCTGYFVNPDDNYHEFDVTSDDGSMLYVGGALIVNNDGLHSTQDVKSEKYLEAQVYSFQVNYFQGPGNVALIVNEDGNPLPAVQLYH